MVDDVRVAALLQAAPGQETAVEAAALACVAPTRDEAGNTMYVLHRDTRDPALFVFIEHWQDRQALERHMQTPHFKTLEQALAGKLAHPMAVHVLTPLGR